jgi:DnaJ-class molecular chaperone
MAIINKSAGCGCRLSINAASYPATGNVAIVSVEIVNPCKKHTAQQSVQADKCPDCDGKGWFGAQFCEGEECPTCEGTGICR